MADDCEICPLTPVLELMSGRWKPEILWALRDDTRRFNQLRRLIPKVTPKMLTRQLRELERDGLLVRTQYNEIPPRVEYSTSELGHSLKSLHRTLIEWGDQHKQQIFDSRSDYDRIRDVAKSA